MAVAALLLLLLSSISSVRGDRVWFGDTTDFHVIDGQNYEADNIYVVNGTTLTLENGSILAPNSGKDGESAVRVDDAMFVAMNGTISGGLGVGGTGVTISTTRDGDYPPGVATFNEGVVVYGGDATRDRTTKGGDAVQVLQEGSKVVINGGKFVAGAGCSIKTCGTQTGDGVALQVIEGEAIIQGGTFQGILFNSGGAIELHGCVEYDKETEKITGVLLDGSSIDVVYEGQNNPPQIAYNSDVCPPPEAPPKLENGVGGSVLNYMASMSVSVVLGLIVTLS